MSPIPLGLVVLAGLSAPAQPLAKSAVPWWVPPAYRDAEFTRMFFACVNEPIMRIGYGKGWFGPAQSRYSWKWVAERHGLSWSADLPAEKFKGSPEVFAALDRDKNGILRTDDFDWSDDDPFVRQTDQAYRWLARADKDNDHKLSKAEWDALFAKFAGGKSYMSVDDARRLLFPPAPPRSAPPPGAMPSKGTILVGLLTGELGSSRP